MKQEKMANKTIILEQFRLSFGKKKGFGKKKITHDTTIYIYQINKGTRNHLGHFLTCHGKCYNALLKMCSLI